MTIRRDPRYPEVRPQTLAPRPTAAERVAAVKASTRPRPKKKPHRTEKPPTHTVDNSVALSVLALELDIDRDDLERQLDGQHFADDLGRRAVDRDTARELIAQHEAERAARRDYMRSITEPKNPGMSRQEQMRRNGIRGGVPIGRYGGGVADLLHWDPDREESPRPEQPPPNPRLPDYEPKFEPHVHTATIGNRR